MWAGALKADFAIKVLLPSIINNNLWEDISVIPKYKPEEINLILKSGGKTKVIRKNT
ncbi:hypothetical protein B14911_03394 [Bacillus sp. NRRL B-14911]|nr:hypothetical protein B14911_03394 [Bacillus sp. NRRL B-14911]